MRFRLMSVASLALLSLLQWDALAAAPAETISVADLVRLADVGDPGDLTFLGDMFGSEPPEAGIFSPDRSQVAVLINSGEPKTETNNASLRVYRTDTLMQDAEPLTLAQFGATGIYHPIGLVRWLGDNATVVFAGTQGAGVPQIYRVNTRTHALDVLTHLAEVLSAYQISSSGQRLVVFTPTLYPKPQDDAECVRHGCSVTADDYGSANFGGYPTRVMLTSVYDTATRQSRELTGPESGDSDLDFCYAQIPGFEISPDGRYLIRECRLKAERLPKEWGDYTTDSFMSLKECLEVRNARCWERGVIVDLETGESRSWTDAPQPPSYRRASPIWIDGGRQLLLPMTFESLKGITGKARELRERAYAVEALNVSTRKLTVIGHLDSRVATTTHASWSEATQVLSVNGEDTKRAVMPPECFRREGENWGRVKCGSPSHRGHVVSSGDTNAALKLVVEQSTSEPPVLVALDTKSGLKRKLLDLNPWLGDRRLTRIETHTWRTSTGHTMRGALYYPVDYQPGTRYPLFIQTHGFNPKKFSLAGIARNFPGEALAAQGIFVLQMGEYEQDAYKTQVWADYRAGYESAIDYLYGLGLIDRTKVGLVGWSASGSSIASMLTHSEYPIAAAAFTDTAVFGWWYYMVTEPTRTVEARLGGSPFEAKGLAQWLELSPTFNFQRLRTPMLIWGLEGAGPWDWYIGLRRAAVPMEMWGFAGQGTHDIFQPSQRLRLNQMLVDWFRFWLKGEERSAATGYAGDTAETLADQYSRWRELRKQQDELVSHPRPPLLKWVPTPVS